MITRWLTYIRLFDFDVKHIPGNKNGGADALSRRGLALEDPDELSDDVDDYFDAKIFNIQIEPRQTQYAHRPPYHLGRIWLLEGEYTDGDLTLGRYLETLQRPEDITDQAFQQLRKKSRLFLVRDGYLFKRSLKRGLPLRRVLGRPQKRIQAIQSLHDEIGHRRIKSTYENVSR